MGAPVGSDAIRIVMQTLFAAALALTLWSAHRHGNWLVAAGWGTFALLLTTSWLLPWYVVWLLPIAAMTGDFKLRLATLAMTAFVIGMRLPIWLA